MSETLNFKPPMELPPSQPESPPLSSGEVSKVKEKSVDVDLSIEERQTLQATLKQLDTNLLVAWNRRGEKHKGAKGEALRAVRRELIRQPTLIQNGLHYAETRSHTLSVINSAISLFKELNPQTHFSERESSTDQSLMESLFDALRNESAAITAELEDEESPDQDITLSVLSEMLDSPDAEQRAYAGDILIRQLPLLMAKLYAELDDPDNETSIANAWQNLVLRVEDSKQYIQASGALKNVWEAKEEQHWGTLEAKIFQPILRVRSKPLERNKDFVTRSAIELAGLDGARIIDEWGMAGSLGEEKKYGPSHQYAYESNLKALYLLKDLSADAPKALHDEFGITHFGRYPTEVLHRQYEERENQDPYGIVLFPYADHNGAFTGIPEVFARLQTELGGNGFRLRIIEAESKHGIGKRLLHLDRKYASGEGGNQVEFAIIGGHGTKESILFGDGRGPSQQIHMADLEGQGTTRGAAQIFRKGARVALMSCSTGMAGGIARKMKDRFGWTVLAPPKDVALKDISVRFHKGRVILDTEYRDVISNESVAARIHSPEMPHSSLSLDK